MAAQGNPCPPEYNIADHLLDVAIYSEAPEVIVEGGKKMKSLFTKTSRVNEKPDKASEEEKAEASKELSVADVNDLLQASFLTQLQLLSKRSWTVLLREKSLLLSHWIVAILLGVLIGGLYFQLDFTIAGLQNNLGSIFFVISVGLSSTYL